MNRYRVVALMVAVAAIALILPTPAGAQTGGLSFYAVTPCRAVDTRNGYGGTVSSSVTRNFTIQGGLCGVPSGAKAVALNLTITQPTVDGFVTLWPAGGAFPVVSNINFVAGEQALANGAIVPLASTTPDLSLIYGVGSGSATVDIILDVTGYFQ